MSILGSIWDVALNVFALMCWIPVLVSWVDRFLHKGICTFGELGLEHNLDLKIVLTQIAEKGNPHIFCRKVNIVWYKLFQALKGKNKGWFDTVELYNIHYKRGKKYENKKYEEFMFAPTDVCGVCLERLKYKVYPFMTVNIDKVKERGDLLITVACSEKCKTLLELANI